MTDTDDMKALAPWLPEDYSDLDPADQAAALRHARGCLRESQGGSYYEGDDLEELWAKTIVFIYEWHVLHTDELTCALDAVQAKRADGTLTAPDIEAIRSLAEDILSKSITVSHPCPTPP